MNENYELHLAVDEYLRIGMLIRIRIRIGIRVRIFLSFVLLGLPVKDILGQDIIIRNFASIVIGKRSMAGDVLAVVAIRDNLTSVSVNKP